MSFYIALRGIASAQTDLDATANNIANVNTIGFKKSRAEFADVFLNSVFSYSKTATGSGVSTNAVAQQFTQGSIQVTDNALDMAISGGGFFVTSTDENSLDFSFKRAGAFRLNANNNLVDSNGNYLRGFTVDENGNSNSISLATTQAIKVPDAAGSPVSSQNVNMKMNLDASAETKDVTNFDPNDSTSYNSSTSMTIYDSLGEPHLLTTYFVRPNDAAYTGESNWVAFYALDGQQVDLAGGGAVNFSIDANGDGNVDGQVAAANGAGWTGSVLTFNGSGTYVGSNPATVTTEQLGLGGANALPVGTDAAQSLTISFNNPTQFSSPFEIASLSQDGSSVGQLTNVEVGEDGLVVASYSNGVTSPLGRVALANFANEQGLIQKGNSSWRATIASGDAISGEAGSGLLGVIRASSLESSNVDLTTELVDLISAQRNFQANSRSLEVSNTLQQTILQIR